jgi:hypothetical protein
MLEEIIFNFISSLLPSYILSAPAEIIQVKMSVSLISVIYIMGVQIKFLP